MDISKLHSRQFLSLSIFAFFLCALFYFLYQLYILYRNRIIRLECWFCKALTSVSVKDKNSFFCSLCHQYNGFNDSGDYNCNLPAQYDVRLNPQSFAIRSNGVTARSFKSDIFCTVCSQRQAYKIEQLAQFEPTDEANWDQELSQFKKELENRCMLCPSCMIKVHKRINNVSISSFSVVPFVMRTLYNRDWVFFRLILK